MPRIRVFGGSIIAQAPRNRSQHLLDIISPQSFQLLIFGRLFAAPRPGRHPLFPCEGRRIVPRDRLTFARIVCYFELAGDVVT